MDKYTALVAVIEAVVFLIPLGTLIWKMSSLASRVKQNENDIKEVKQEQKENISCLNAKIDKLLGSVNEIKISIAEIKSNNKKGN